MSHILLFQKKKKNKKTCGPSTQYLKQTFHTGQQNTVHNILLLYRSNWDMYNSSSFARGKYCCIFTVTFNVSQKGPRAAPIGGLHAAPLEVSSHF